MMVCGLMTGRLMAILAMLTKLAKLADPRYPALECSFEVAWLGPTHGTNTLMKIANASDVKNRFGEYLDIARLEPVAVNRNGRNIAVLLSAEEYERLSALDDAWWAAQAKASAASGYLGPEKSMELLMKLIREKK
jgi:prevent-host-death family protein